AWARGAKARRLAHLRTWSAGSLRLDLGRPDHLAPLPGFIGNELAKLRRRQWQWGSAKVGYSLLEPAVGEPGIDLAVEGVDNFSRCTFWRADAEKRAGFIAGHEFTDGRDIRQRCRSGRRRDGQRAQLAGSDVTDRRGNALEHDLYLPAHQIHQSGCSAAISNRNQIGTGHCVEQLAANMRCGPITGRRHIELSRVGFGI